MNYFEGRLKEFYGPGGVGGTAIDTALDRASAKRAASVTDAITDTTPWGEGAFVWVNGRWAALNPIDAVYADNIP